MAGYEINVGSELLPGLLNGPNGLAKLVETVLNQILEAQVAELVGAQRHERSEERQGYRNGYRARTLYMRVRPVTLQVQQTRDGSFSTDIFKCYQRGEQAFVLALMEIVVQGVSALRLIGARLAEKNEVWQERKYLDMDEFNDWAASQNMPDDGGNLIAMNG